MSGRILWASARDGTYKQPHNIRRLRKQAIKDFGIRQFKRVGAQREFNELIKKEAANAS